jgi:hypothetical protein
MATTQPDSSATSGDAQQALKAIEERLTLTYGLCCGTAPKQSVGELLAVALKMPEWETLRRATAQAPQAATTEQAGAVTQPAQVREAILTGAHAEFSEAMPPGSLTDLGHRNVVNALRAAIKFYIQFPSPAATTASASGLNPAQEFLNWNRLQKEPPVAISKEMGVFRMAMEIAEACRAQAPSRDAAGSFAEWLAREMPAGTVINDPAWWAPRILRVALAGREAAPLVDKVTDIIELYAESYDSMGRMNGGDNKVGCYCVATDLRQNIIPQVRAALAQPAAPVVDGELPPLPVFPNGQSATDLTRTIKELMQRAGSAIPASLTTDAPTPLTAIQVAWIVGKVAAARSAPVGAPITKTSEKGGS